MTATLAAVRRGTGKGLRRAPARCGRGAPCAARRSRPAGRRWPPRPSPPRRRRRSAAKLRAASGAGERAERSRRDPAPGGRDRVPVPAAGLRGPGPERPGGGQRPGGRAARPGRRLEQAAASTPRPRRESTRPRGDRDRISRAPGVSAAARPGLGRASRSQPGDGGSARVAGADPVRPAAGRLRGAGRRRLRPRACSTPRPPAALQTRPREALQPEPGGRARRLLGGLRQRPPRPEHPPADLAAPAGRRCRTSRAARTACAGGGSTPRSDGTRARGLQAEPAGGTASRGPKDRFEALMAYFHIDRAQHYIQSLGFSDATSRTGSTTAVQVVVADAFKADNSFYSPATRQDQVRLRRRGRRRGRRRDPARVRPRDPGRPGRPASASRPSGGRDRRGLRRLLGGRDVRPAHPAPRNEDDVCIFDWDGVTWGSFVRAFRPQRAGGARTATRPCPRDPGQAVGIEIHCVGQVWSSALWDLRTEYGIGADDLDRIVLASQFMYTADERFDEAVRRPGGRPDAGRSPAAPTRPRSAPRWRDRPRELARERAAP